MSVQSNSIINPFQNEDDRLPDGPDECVICYETMQNKAFVTDCLHNFCYLCLIQWTKIKAVCPLCVQPINQIIKNVKSINDYEIQPIEPPHNDVLANHESDLDDPTDYLDFEYEYSESDDDYDYAEGNVFDDRSDEDDDYEDSSIVSNIIQENNHVGNISLPLNSASVDHQMISESNSSCDSNSSILSDSEMVPQYVSANHLNDDGSENTDNSTDDSEDQEADNDYQDICSMSNSEDDNIDFGMSDSDSSDDTDIQDSDDSDVANSSDSLASSMCTTNSYYSSSFSDSDMHNEEDYDDSDSSC